MMMRKHTDETKRKISEGVKRHYANMSAEAETARREKISNFRQKENKVYHFCRNNKDIIKRVLDEIKREREERQKQKDCDQ